MTDGPMTGDRCIFGTRHNVLGMRAWFPYGFEPFMINDETKIMIPVFEEEIKSLLV